MQNSVLATLLCMTILHIYMFAILFVAQGVRAGGGWVCEDCALLGPTVIWKNKCRTHFEGLGIYNNFSRPVAHVLHRISIEDVKFFFNIDLPENNGIPTQNQNLSASNNDSVLRDIPSRPSGVLTSGYHAFSLVMDHIDDPDWDTRGNPLERLIHAYHMQEVFTKVRANADQWEKAGVTDDVCSCALDTDGNGIDEELWVKWKYLRDEFNMPNYTQEFGVPELVDQASWSYWKNWKNFHMITETHEPEGIKRAGLYMHCALRKYQDCWPGDKKTVGPYSYTKVATEIVPSCLSNCIYERDGLENSRFCFRYGTLSVYCN